MSIVTLEDHKIRAEFVRTLAMAGHVFAVGGFNGFARVPSPRTDGRDVTLMWTNRDETARWADALVVQPRVATLTVEALLAQHLPKEVEAGRSIGINWSDSPVEPEFEPMDLANQLRRELVSNFLETTTKLRHVWVLKRDEAPLTLETSAPAGGEVLPVFADRAAAERAIDGDWMGAQPTRIPMADFLQKAIVWCAETRRRIAPAYVAGPGLIEHHAWEVKAMLSGHMPLRRVA